MHKQRGFTLIELMIASLLGMIVIGGIMSLFTTTNRSITLMDAISQNQETGRFAMEYMTKFIREAGYSEDPMVTAPIVFGPVGKAGFANFVDCSGTWESAACAANNPSNARGDRLSIPFVVPLGQTKRSCTGTQVTGVAGTPYFVNVFWVSDASDTRRQLRCRTYDQGTKTWLDTPVTILNNVEYFEFQLGLAEQPSDRHASRYVSVDTMVNDNQLLHVRSVRIAILTTSQDSANLHQVQTNVEARTYGLLDAPFLTIDDGSLRNIFSNTIELPNAIETAIYN